LISWHAYKKYIGIIQIEKDTRLVIKTLKAGFPYAADAGFTNFFQQMDTIIVNHYLGLAGVGLYQAATKWLQGAMQFAPVLANVYLPTLAANTNNIEVNNNYAKKLNIQMLVIGVCGCAFFMFAGSHLSNFIYGERYQEISSLWPLVGLLMLTRYVAASQGVILVAYGKQKIRVFVQVVSLSVFLVSAVFLVQHFGLVGILMALVITFMTTFFIYTYNIIKFKFPTGFSSVTAVFTAVIFIVAMLLSYLNLA
jgi:O-antigen/teichoic acid export membrane protein